MIEKEPSMADVYEPKPLVTTPTADGSVPAEQTAAGEPAAPAPAEGPPPALPNPERASAYIAKRLEPQIAWFEAKSADSKRKHTAYSTTQIAATAMIPVANLLPNSSLSSTILAAIAGLAAGLAALGSHRNHWLRYRSAADALHKLRVHYDLKVPPFDGDDADLHLIDEAEAIFSGEQTNWTSLVRTLTAGKVPTIPLKHKKRDDDDDDNDD